MTWIFYFLLLILVAICGYRIGVAVTMNQIEESLDFLRKEKLQNGSDETIS
jgi:hypothetical protein